MNNEYARNVNTNRLIKKSTSLYRKLKKLNQVEEIGNEKESKTEEPVEPVRPEEPEEPEEPEVEFDEARLQTTLADISTGMIQKNLKKIVRSQKLTDADMDTMLRKMLYKKLCLSKPEKPEKSKKLKKKAKRVVVSSDSDSDSSD
jgi:hypothetical protein